MDLDSIKSQWQKADASPNLPDQEKLLELTRKKNVRTASEKLARRFRVLGCLSFLAIVLVRPLHNILGDAGNGLLIVYALFMLLLGIMDMWLFLCIKNGRWMELPIARAYEGVTRFRILRLRLQVVSILLAIPLLAWMLWLFYQSENEGVFIGGLVGLVAGLIAGLFTNARINREIRFLKDELSDQVTE
ncbi:MAG: hypothetical protein LIP02_09000 [Bacteroidales bacterium]|nr:hypothetical protein [Bacteroidales bacterium]